MDEHRRAAIEDRERRETWEQPGNKESQRQEREREQDRWQAGSYEGTEDRVKTGLPVMKQPGNAREPTKAARELMGTSGTPGNPTKAPGNAWEQGERTGTHREGTGEVNDTGNAVIKPGTTSN
jgi:hypothetical protein